MKSDISGPDTLKTLKDTRGGKCFAYSFSRAQFLCPDRYNGSISIE